MGRLTFTTFLLVGFNEYGMGVPIIASAEECNIDFSKRELKGLITELSQFYNVSFEEEKISNEKFIEGQFKNVSFAHADLRGARLDA